ncbi:hypothetical protein [uncultured Winogradskyella sp.]|uniref:hypothetical protein n=1 Tax=uncultured Winogradskyella sp. TaxID=395353 RepID=UPI00261CEBD4|nr:hypothetical protein [uncultured Winogradskyella sp.]
MEDESKQKKFNSRFIYISIGFVLATLISWHFTYNTDHFLTTVKISSIGLFAWSVWEYNLLKYNHVYLKLLALSLLLALTGYYFLLEEDASTWLRVTKMSLCFLILFRVLRYFYILIYNREPKLEKTKGRMADRMFSFIVIAGTALVTMAI